ncbi:hypothetical protein ACQPZF_10925 [Actinosynnema sp. CS-041913]|uniref:hypothetical protein n=1 Tax=Actinosynnema sp. CS-041913 TaxID=3239917 RepID=UPI003D93B2B0
MVVTTRRRDTALLGHGRRIVDVGTFTEAEAEAYLTGIVGQRTRLLDGAAELAAALGCLPLALAQAAAYMLDRNLSCTAYLERLTDRRRRLAAVPPENAALPDSHRAGGRDVVDIRRARQPVGTDGNGGSPARAGGPTQRRRNSC